MPSVLLFLALVLLAACDSGERQRLQLEELERMNRADSVMLNDSLARDLADWFDRHGTRNEQLRAYYMLGRTYADRGEAPQAIIAYNDAINSADTTNTDCDYKILCRVYAQMATVLYHQDLYRDGLEKVNRAVYYGFLAKDTLAALMAYTQKLDFYDMLQQPDSMLFASTDVYEKLRQVGYNSYAAEMLIGPIRYLTDIGDLQKARELMNRYESETGFFDAEGNICKGREVFYYHKGLYYLKACQYDSAEYCFRKELSEGKDFNNQNAGAYGLAMLFQQIHRPDSAAKYAIYSYAMNDSVYSRMSTQTVARMQAMYDYSHHQHIAQQEKERADYERNKATSYLFILVLIVAIGGYIVYLQIKRRQAADTAYQNKVSELERVQNDVLLLRSQEEDKNAVLREKEEEMTNLQKELSVLRGKIEQISESAESQLLKNVGYKHLTDIAEAGKLMTEEDWRDVNKLVIDVLPEFSQYISNRKHSLNIVEYRTAILFRLHIRSKSIHYMLGISPQYVSKVKGQLCEKLFQNKMGSLKFLEEKLSEFN